jgi:HAD superfamily hydrolase (TIGR01549 family)
MSAILPYFNSMARTRAVVFDVDFTLIYPGPVFRGEGYHAFCARHDIRVDPAKFDGAVASAASILDDSEDSSYDAEIFVAYTRHIIEQMGGTDSGTGGIDACAREIYAEWAANHHFELYEEVPTVLRELTSAGLRLGLISNSHRCLDSFQSHFELREFVSAAVSSADHGFMKPHPSIFQAALDQLGVAAADAVMVGDSLSQDVEGALKTGMRAILLHRSDDPVPREKELRARGVPVVRSLQEIRRLVIE